MNHTAWGCLGKKSKVRLSPVGFEPTHSKILRPERSALDHSAIVTSIGVGFELSIYW